jgi:flagellar L-ring protein precursor FlgH
MSGVSLSIDRGARRSRRGAVVAVLALGLSGCAVADRLAEIGSPPKMTTIGDVRRAEETAALRYPTPVEPTLVASANSLWRPGSKSFFKDQRATRVGDIVTVAVSTADSASLSNETKRSRSNTDSLSMGNLFGYKQSLLDRLPGRGPSALGGAAELGMSGALNHEGKGSNTRSETVVIKIAAVIVEVLPNGNLVIRGRQELRVNQELREIQVAGIIRPQDIDPSNQISGEKIAEGRISYGGRGIISDVQQPPIGSQVLDIIRPF